MGADIEKADKSGETSLYKAAEKSNQDVCDYLISMDADVNKAEANGWTPFLVAAQKGHLNICKCPVTAG